MKTRLMALMAMVGLAFAPVAFADPTKTTPPAATPELEAFNRAIESAASSAAATTFCTKRVVGCCPNGAQRVKYTCEGGHTIVYKCEGSRC